MADITDSQRQRAIEVLEGLGYKDITEKMIMNFLGLPRSSPKNTSHNQPSSNVFLPLRDAALNVGMLIDEPWPTDETPDFNAVMMYAMRVLAATRQTIADLRKEVSESVSFTEPKYKLEQGVEILPEDKVGTPLRQGGRGVIVAVKQIAVKRWENNSASSVSHLHTYDVMVRGGDEDGKILHDLSVFRLGEVL